MTAPRKDEALVTALAAVSEGMWCRLVAVVEAVRVEGRRNCPPRVDLPAAEVKPPGAGWHWCRPKGGAAADWRRRWFAGLGAGAPSGRLEWGPACEVPSRAIGAIQFVPGDEITALLAEHRADDIEALERALRATENDHRLTDP